MSVGFDAAQLKPLVSGGFAKFENPEKLPVFIDNKHQFCLYMAEPLIEVVDTDKPGKYEVLYGEEVLKPIQCK
ncbi:hypothetical protein P3339_09685 [Microbulbifer sp. MLAF003]|uniref:hypothetical protein n=1 Tax=unclassified Microbulbifer TaxID=2619833 RepID=UPI0024AD85B4|nr:hypothetical protein [Microbulbifer sp. MLAF003]WHI53011.1 hypothetical protein P3339_09685 [Microbulbifer sp. MLAF003]